MSTRVILGQVKICRKRNKRTSVTALDRPNERANLPEDFL